MRKQNTILEELLRGSLTTEKTKEPTTFGEEKGKGQTLANQFFSIVEWIAGNRERSWQRNTWRTEVRLEKSQKNDGQNKNVRSWRFGDFIGTQVDKKFTRLLWNAADAKWDPKNMSGVSFSTTTKPHSQFCLQWSHLCGTIKVPQILEVFTKQTKRTPTLTLDHFYKRKLTPRWMMSARFFKCSVHIFGMPVSF